MVVNSLVIRGDHCQQFGNMHAWVSMCTNTGIYMCYTRVKLYNTCHLPILSFYLILCCGSLPMLTNMIF